MGNGDDTQASFSRGSVDSLNSSWRYRGGKQLIPLWPKELNSYRGKRRSVIPTSSNGLLFFAAIRRLTSSGSASYVQTLKHSVCHGGNWIINFGWKLIHILQVAFKSKASLFVYFFKQNFVICSPQLIAYRQVSSCKTLWNRSWQQEIKMFKMKPTGRHEIACSILPIGQQDLGTTGTQT